MKEDTIVQFECFETTIEPDEFVLRWEHYAKRLASKDIEVTLQQQTGIKNRFKYVSQHKWPQDNFRFVFMKGRYSENFPECNVKVIQAGGYAPVQIECIHDTDADDVKIMLFTSRAETDISFYKQLSSYRYLNIYQAYYESSLYAYILEFFVEQIHARELIRQIKTQTADTEIGMYKECLVLDE